MKKQKTAYELTRSQVATPLEIVKLFWQITNLYRSNFDSILDLGAGDGRFALGGNYRTYEGIEIDRTSQPIYDLPKNAKIRYGCAFDYEGRDSSACIGNPPYVRHHDLDELWRDSVAKWIRSKTNIVINRKCNLYIYFLFLALIRSRKDGLVSVLVPYEWISRPSASPLRKYISSNRWHVDIYRLSQQIFNGVLTTASISVIDKKGYDGKWRYFDLSLDESLSELKEPTGSNERILPYENRGEELWAMRGMSPGTQKVFTLSEGERIHAGLKYIDVLPCVTSLREVPKSLTRLTYKSFHKRFIESGAKCWLIKSHSEKLSHRLQAYLNAVPKTIRDTWTCNSRDIWYKFSLSNSPNLLVSSGFTSFGPKILVNSMKAYAIGSVCGIYGNNKHRWTHLRNYLSEIDFEKRIVPHANSLKKLEIRQLNAVLNRYLSGDGSNV